MSEHRVSLEWSRRRGADFDYKSYSRDHDVIFGENSRICASAAPEYRGNGNCFNPEQAFVTSLASCHMLTFLAIASKKGFIVDSYSDSVVGVLGRNSQHKPAIVRVELKPQVEFAEGAAPSKEEYERLHSRAHSECFISNSIASCVEVVVNPGLKSA